MDTNYRRHRPKCALASARAGACCRLARAGIVWPTAAGCGDRRDHIGTWCPQDIGNAAKHGGGETVFGPFCRRFRWWCVAHSSGGQGVAGSNPASPTTATSTSRLRSPQVRVDFVRSACDAILRSGRGPGKHGSPRAPLTPLTARRVGVTFAYDGLRSLAVVGRVTVWALEESRRPGDRGRASIGL